MSEDYCPSDRAREMYRGVTENEIHRKLVGTGGVSISLETSNLPIGGETIDLRHDDYPYFRDALINTYAVRQGMIDDE